MKNILLFRKPTRLLFWSFSLLFLFSSNLILGQVVAIASQNFETTPATPTLTFTTADIGTPSFANFSTGTSGTSASPNANMFSEGSRGYRIAGDTGTTGRTLIFSNVDVSGYSGVSFSFRVAGMSIGSTTNGMDATGSPNENDKVLVEVSPDGGGTWYQQAKVVSSGGNLRWYFGATGSGTRDYVASNALSSFATTANVLTGSGNTAISTVTITNLPIVTNLKVRITATADASNESWIIDDVKITGTVASTVPPVVTSGTANGTVGAAMNYQVVASNNPTSYSYTGTLPAGLSFSTTTGVISGTPTAVSSSAITVTASNGVGSGTAGTITFNIGKGNQTITFGTLANKTYGDANFTISATASSTLPVTFTSLNEAVATVSGNTVTIVGVGTATIRASQAGSDDYNAATNVDRTFTVNKRNITIVGMTGNGKVYDATTVATVSGGTLNGVLPADAADVALSTSPTYTFSSANVGSRTIAISNLVLEGSKAVNYSLTLPTPVSLSATISAKTLTVTNAVAQNKVYNGNTVATVTGATLNGVETPDVSTVTLATNGTFATPNAGDNIAVTLSLLGNSLNNYSLTQPGLTANILKADQTITFNPIPVQVAPTAPVNLNTYASASSGLTLSYSSSNNDVVSVSGNTMTIVGAGTATITASQAGNGNYNAAVSQAQTVTVITAPIATIADNVSCDRFTAHWNAVAGADSYEVDVYTQNEIEAPELVTNGGFEAGDKSGWNSAASGFANYTIQTASPNSGVYYTSRSTGGSGSSILQQDVTVEIGKTYVFSFWYNNYNASETNGLKNFTIQGTSGGNYIDSGTPKLPAANTWTKYEKVFTATNSTIRISVRAYQLADIDDISLKLSGSIVTTVPVAGSPFTVVPTEENPTTSLVVTGLTSGTDYYYRVRAKSGSVVSGNSTPANTTTNAALLVYVDNDGDGFGTGEATSVCTLEPGHALVGGDCNDNNFDVKPSAIEKCWNNIDDNCDGVKSEGCAPVVINMATANNYTLPNFSIAVSAHGYTYPGATTTTYRFTITNNTTLTTVEVLSPSRFVTIPNALRTYNSTYTITAAAVIDGEEVPYAGNSIVVNSPVISKIKLAPTSCDVQVSTLSATISANPGLNATGYRFRLRLTSDNGVTPTYYYATPTGRFTTLSSFDNGFVPHYNASYTVDVEYSFVDVSVVGQPVIWSGYGDTCTITTPGIPNIGLSSPICGSTTPVTSKNATISATPALYALNYEFRLRLTSDNGQTPTYYTTTPSSSRFSTLGSFTGLTVAYNTSYTISVRYQVMNNGVPTWSNYGSECTILSPNFPTTGFTSCDPGSYSLSHLFTITPVSGATYQVYLYEQVDETVVLVGSIPRNVPNFSLNMFSGTTVNKNYTAYVAVKLGSEEGSVGQGCDISTYPAASPVARIAAVPFAVKAYPNPYSNAFQLDVTSTDKTASIDVKVFDMLGRMVDSKNTTAGDLETATIGSDYPSGVYNVIVTQGDETKVVRVVKR